MSVAIRVPFPDVKGARIFPLATCVLRGYLILPCADPLGIPAVFYYLLSTEGSYINPDIGNDLPEPRGTKEVTVSTLVPNLVYTVVVVDIYATLKEPGGTQDVVVCKTALE